MNWFEPQIVTRAKNDVEQTEHAYAKLAASVAGPKNISKFSIGSVSSEDAAVCACLKYIRVNAGKVPDNVEDLEDRIEWLCRPSGTMRRNVRLDPGWQKQAFGPMLGFLQDGTPVALLPHGANGYYYIQPKTGRKVPITKKVSESLLTEAVLFYKPLPPKPLTMRDLVSFIFGIFGAGDYLLVIIASIATVLIGLVPAWANNVAFSMVVPSGQASLVLPIGALLLGAAISSGIIQVCRSLVMSRVSTKLNVVTEAATYSRVISLHPSFFKERTAGDLANRTATITILTESITSILLGSGLSALLSLAYIGQIAVFAPALAIPALIVALVQAALSVLATVAPIKYERAAMESNAKLSGLVATLLNGIQKIKLAGAEDRAFATWADGYADYAQYIYNRPRRIVVLPSLVGITGLAGAVVIYYIASIAHVNVAGYMSFSVAFGQINGAFLLLASTAGEFARIQPMLDLVAPILEAEPELAENKTSVTSLSGAIEVSNVSFRYGDHLPLVLDNISFAIRPGEYVGIVGRSGSGKSTILRLLLGFEKPLSGSVFYDRYDVDKVEKRSLRQHIGVVLQDGKLFQGDIFSNIIVSTPAATLDDAWDAAEVASIADDIRKMPMGMQTLLSEGDGGVSGGQRQRLMIARAVCGKNKILMLDEATSALDNKTQRNISDSLDKLKCTRIVIAHRLSTIRHCDRILLVDEGKIAEEGNYDELMAKNGLFAELVKRQRLDG